MADPTRVERPDLEWARKLVAHAEKNPAARSQPHTLWAESALDLEARLREIADRALRFTVEQMHFHEIAMADPFKAERIVLEYADEVRRAALSGDEAAE